MEIPSLLVTQKSIQDRFYRALTPAEEAVIPAWIADAWDDLLDRDDLRLEARLAGAPEGPRLLGRIARTIRASVIRRLQNPQGRRQYSYSVDDASVSETLATETLTSGWFTEDELTRLTPDEGRADAWTARPSGTSIRRPEVDPWTSH